MFLLSGKGTKYIKKFNGKVLSGMCPECRKQTQFAEVEKQEYLHIFFIPVFKDKIDETSGSLYQCSQCEAVFSFTGVEFKNIFSTLKNKVASSKLYKAYQEKKKDIKINSELKKLKKKMMS